MADPAPSKVKVVVRIRPFVGREVHKRCVVVSHTEKAAIELRRSTHAPVLSYGFDGAYDSDSQQEVLFKNEIEPMIDTVFKGIHTTIFAYGITGAGKTFTMQGSDEQPGLIPRVARKVVALATQRTSATKGGSSSASNKCSVTVSYLEIYNEKVFDLLRPKTKDLPIREDTNKNILIPDLAQLPVRTYEDFANTYAEGCKNRTVAPTNLNAHSSRSHAVLILTVKHRDGNRKYVGKLHLIDLAGSEDNRRTDNTGVRMTESSNINRSLFVLGKVVNALNDGSSRVPYRDSKLTRLLQDSLGGRSYGVMIANISPSVEHYHDTFKTLNFASKSRKIINKPVVNAVDDEASRKALLEEYLELKKRMPSAEGGKENCNPNKRGSKDRSSGGGQKFDMKELDAYIAQKTQEAIEQRIKEMLNGEKVLKTKMENENFKMLKELERRLFETNRRHMEKCFEDDEEEEEINNVKEAGSHHANSGDSRALGQLLTPFTKVATGMEMAQRAKKYAKRGQFDRAIRYYNRMMKIMPEKESAIKKKIAKLEERKRTEATTPADPKSLKGQRGGEDSTPFQPSSSTASLSSLMKSLNLSEDSKKQAEPKKLSFEGCEEKAKTQSSRKPSSVSREKEKKRPRQQTPAGKLLATTSRPASTASLGKDKPTADRSQKRKESKAVLRDKDRRRMHTKAEVVMVDRKPREEVKEETEEEEEDNVQVEDEEETESGINEEPKTNEATSRPRYSESEDEHDNWEEDKDSDYEENKDPRSNKTVARGVRSEDESDDEGAAGGDEGPEGDDDREKEVLRIVNSGSMKQLLELHGIGKKRAEAIADIRPFHKLADLKKIGLGEKLFEAFMKRNVWEAI